MKNNKEQTQNIAKVIIDYEIVDKKTGKVTSSGQLESVTNNNKGEK